MLHGNSPFLVRRLFHVGFACFSPGYVQSVAMLVAGLQWHAVAYQVNDVVMWVSGNGRMSRKSGCFVRYA